MAPGYSTLNPEQKSFYFTVLDDVHNRKDRSRPIVRHIGGAGGTGKSELIAHIVRAIGIHQIILCASTARAARNINGSTIHSLLRLDPHCEKKDDEPITPHPFLLLAIFDEISMINVKLFARIEKRLRQLLQSDVPFGGCVVLLFGDLLQIPPVIVTEPETFMNDQWIFKSPLWKEHVQYFELETVMRQENDPEFAQMLKRWRLGICTEEDHKFLNNNARKHLQDTASEFQKYFSQGKVMTILAHSNAEIGRLNQQITHKFFDKTALFDIVKTTRTYRETTTVPDVSHEVMFQVAEGSRIQIIKNLHGKLINGETGIVQDIISTEKRVDCMSIKLDYADEVVSIPSTVTERRMTKYQKLSNTFSIRPGYAVTYHKAQGQTLDDVMLVTHRFLPPALFYVGASRVRNRESLHILSYNSGASIRADPEALEEYQRLRMSIGKPPLPL